jgi:hypothetical protein
MTILVVAVALLWALMALMSVLVVLLYRQFGLIYIGSRARLALTGLAVGAKAPDVAHLRMAGRGFSWSWNAEVPGRGTLVIFGQPQCLLCAELTPQLNNFADKWAHLVDLIFVERGPLPAGPTHDPANRTQWMYAEDPNGELHAAFDIEATPYAFAVDSARRVLAKGIVNGVSDLEGVLSLALGNDGGLKKEFDHGRPSRVELVEGQSAAARWLKGGVAK